VSPVRSDLEEILAKPDLKVSPAKPDLKEILVRSDLEERLVKPDLKVSKVKPDLEERLVKPDLKVSKVKPDLEERLVKPDLEERLVKPDLKVSLASKAPKEIKAIRVRPVDLCLLPKVNCSHLTPSRSLSRWGRTDLFCVLIRQRPPGCSGTDV